MCRRCNLKISETLQITRLDFCNPNPLLAWKFQRTTKLKQSTYSLLKISLNHDSCEAQSKDIKVSSSYKILVLLTTESLAGPEILDL